MNVEPALIHFVSRENQNVCQASGIILNSNLVLTTGFILQPLISIPEQKKWLLSFVESTSSRIEENEHFCKDLFIVTKEFSRNPSDHSSTNQKLVSSESKVIGFWSCPLVKHSQETFLNAWTLGNESIVDADLIKKLMSIFILLRCKGNEEYDKTDKNKNVREYLSEFGKLYSVLKEPNRGEEIEIISTPFGMKFFVNSLSTGIISNVFGVEKCFVLTDARTVSGCEGGPIFSAAKPRKQSYRTLIGIVGCSLTWCRGEWVGLTLGVNLRPVLKRLLENEKILINFSRVFEIPFHHAKSDLLSVDEIVVLIRSETCWGSGVVVDAFSGTILTCSHNVRDDEKVLVFHKNNQILADVIFKSSDGLAYDLALIRTNQKLFFQKEANITEKPAKLGDVVIAAGFPFFNEKDSFINLFPTIARGCVAKANPFMIQTTCCIQSGFSGGALLRNGQLLGIIICNTKNSSAGALFPHINFAIPSTVFKRCLSEYLRTNNYECLKTLVSVDPKVQSLWSFQYSKF